MSAMSGHNVPHGRLLKAAIFRIEHLLMPGRFWQTHCIGEPRPGEPHAAFKQALIEQAVAAVEQATMRLLGKPAPAFVPTAAALAERAADLLVGDAEYDDYLELADATEDLRVLLATAGSEFSDPGIGVPPMGRNLCPT